MSPIRLGLLLTAILVPMGDARAAPVGTGFTYQGSLEVSGSPANGAFDFEFALFDVVDAGTALATVLRDDAPVSRGLFTVELDYTDVPFAAAQAYFLEVRVRAGAETGGYTQLLPRQKLTPAPYAVNARTVQPGGVDQDAIAPGAVGSPQLQAGAVGSPQLTDLAVTNAKLASAAITDAKIANGTISLAKLAFVPGDVTGVAAGSGLTGGGAGGDLALAVDTIAIQARITGTCAIGEYFRGIAADGTVVCEPVPGLPHVTTVDDPVNAVGRHTSIAIGRDGLPVISYYDVTAGALKVAKCANGACTGTATITTLDDPANTVGEYTSLAIGGDGLPVISYMDISAGTLKVAKCANAACTGAPTITSIDVALGTTVFQYTSIAIGTDGLPVIGYHDFTAGSLKVAKCSSPACTGASTITTVDDPASANNVGLFASLAIGIDGLPVIGYFDLTAGTLKVAKCANAACTGASTITAVDDPAGGNAVGRYIDLAVGSDGLPGLAYQDFTTFDLKVAKCANAACTGTATITTVDDSSDSVGLYASIAIGVDGLPVIGYWDSSAFSLKVAKCRDAACAGTATLTTLDDQAEVVGAFTSLAIGSDGLPVISYRNTDAGTLKVAKCGTRSCQ